MDDEDLFKPLSAKKMPPTTKYSISGNTISEGRQRAAQNKRRTSLIKRKPVKCLPPKK